LKTSLFDYELPNGYIAQTPADPRDSSRLMVLDRRSGAIEHRHFYEIGDYLQVGDLLVANDSRVIPARLNARKSTGGKSEILLLQQLDDTGERWQAMVRGRNILPGSELKLDNGSTAASITVLVEDVDPSGTRTIRFSESVTDRLQELGEIPLPPYITGYHGDAERYQTVYNRSEGSVAAPTAGLHFTPELLINLRRREVMFDTVTLHVGLDTFRPVESEEIEKHQIHSEIASLSSDVARRINETTLSGHRIIAVGTTTVRTLEWAATEAQGIDPYDPAACPWKRTSAFSGAVDLYIRPGYRFRAVDALITNFHLPRSSLLMLVSAFVGQDKSEPDEGRRMLLDAYEVAKKEGYRFFSYGDAMMIL
jgi:S-adenosylmethionine:tRNA ribosyltransferase-isomerase